MYTNKQHNGVFFRVSRVRENTFIGPSLSPTSAGKYRYTKIYNQEY